MTSTVEPQENAFFERDGWTDGQMEGWTDKQTEKNSLIQSCVSASEKTTYGIKTVRMQKRDFLCQQNS